jgi:hypothetical protein
MELDEQATDAVGGAGGLDRQVLVEAERIIPALAD